MAFLSILAVLMPALIASVVGADGSSVYTSTADFDTGTKSIYSPEYFAGNGHLQMTNWIGYPNAAQFNGRTYVVWEGTTALSMFIRYYDTAGSGWSQTVQLPVTNPISTDDHGSPSIATDSQGFIHVFCCAHASKLVYMRSAAVESISAWIFPGNLTGGGSEGSYTYPHPVRIGNTLYLISRYSPEEPADWVIQSLQDNGTWTARQSIISVVNPDITGYLGGTDISGTKIHFTWARQKVDLLRYDVYEGWYETTTGHTWCLPAHDEGISINETEAAADCRAVDTVNTNTDFGSVHTDSDGKPYIIYNYGQAPTVQVQFVRWDGSAWTSPQTITTNDDHAYSLADFIINSPTSITAFIVSAGAPGIGGGINQWSWDGFSWTLSSYIRDVSRAIINPVVPRNAAGPISVVFSEGESSEGSFDQNPDAPADQRIYAWGSNGFVKDPSAATTGGLSTGTATDDAVNIPAGDVALMSPVADSFGFPDANGETFRWDTMNHFTTFCSVTANDISAGVRHIGTSGTDAGAACYVGSISRVHFTGNWDTSIKVSVTTDVGNLNEWAFTMTNDHRSEPRLCGTGLTGDSVLYRIWDDSVSTRYLQVLKCVNGSFTVIGSSTVAPASTVYLRLTKSGNTYTGYYGTNGVDWTQDEQFTDANIPGPFYAAFYVAAPGVVSTAGEFDDFRISGASFVEGFPSSGYWDSPLQPDRETISQVMMTYSGASSSTFISGVSAVCNGAVQPISTTVLTSGSSATVMLSEVDQSYMADHCKVRVLLGSTENAQSSVKLETVSISTRTSALSKIVTDFTIFVFMAILVLAVMGAVWLRHRFS